MTLLDQIPTAKTIGPARHALLDYGVVATFLGMGMTFRGRNNRAAASFCAAMAAGHDPAPVIG